MTTAMMLMTTMTTTKILTSLKPISLENTHGTIFQTP